MKFIKIIVLFLPIIIYADVYADTTYAEKHSLGKEFDKIIANSGDSWEKLWPNEEKRIIIMKLNRTNIPLKKDYLIIVPKNFKGKSLIDFSPFPKQSENKYKHFVWDPKLLAWAVYNKEGVLLRWGPGVGGKDYCEDIKRECRTIVGKFIVLAKGGPKIRSLKYPPRCGWKKCTIVPWFIKFHKDGYGIHGSDNIQGYHASHGCIRVFLDDAKWINQQFVQYGTTVIVRPY